MNPEQQAIAAILLALAPHLTALVRCAIPSGRLVGYGPSRHFPALCPYDSQKIPAQLSLVGRQGSHLKCNPQEVVAW
ncbi:hypothetical protein [Massilia sp. CCM 8734]|uniref:hypothetical protein n=1 Tax=Massilia sp. CCM 8734 TaxID=2609283 RepID=UPI00141FFB09|nr:hypothetical protein [Massilia sp. CCM 8734]NHZ97461.1 hypothetical protein [Massilia sp. CCM 8734]